ncbi:MAG TPA: hypothetical protein VGS27_12480 [Candidatus Sulfotelmatobacter sp.]|nr:hypothetical protein [Candidatus Sulfotelmatobacter sp.]
MNQDTSTVIAQRDSGASMWGRIDVMIDTREENRVTIHILYDTGRQVHTVTRDHFNTIGPITHTMDPSFTVN